MNDTIQCFPYKLSVYANGKWQDLALIWMIYLQKVHSCFETMYI